MSTPRLALACGALALGCLAAAAVEALDDMPIFADAFESGDCSTWGFCGTGAPALQLLTEPEPSVDFDYRVPIQVRLEDRTGQPIADALVAFEPQADTADTSLSTGALTDDNGIAESVIHGGSQAVDFDLKIRLPKDDTVEPITVRVRIQPKDTADYIVHVEYQGTIQLDRVEVTLYENDRSCATLVESPTADPSDDVARIGLILLPDAEGSLPERGLNIPTDVTLEYALARGKPSDGMGGALGYYATFGCQDTIPSVEPSTATIIEISMHDLLPPR